MKVFLVEDEFVVREGIKNNIKWEEHGFEFCGEASDGELAFPLIQEKKPDIVITDIRMPFMDGLELSRLIKKELPEIKIIILSGHEEFEYAKAAIQIGVEEYLLKPINGEELLQVVNHVAEKIKEEKNKQTLTGEFQMEQEDAVENGKRELISAIVGNQSNEDELVEKAKTLELDMTANNYNFVMLKIYKGNKEQGFSQRIEEIAAKLNDYLSGEGKRTIVFDRAPEGKVILFMEDEEERLKREIREFIVAFKEIKKEYDDIEYFGSIGLFVSSIKDLSKSYDVASHGFSYRFLTDANQFIEGTKLQAANAQTADAIDFMSIKVENLDKEKVEGFLRGGEIVEIDFFVEEYMRNVGEAGKNSLMFRQYIIMDMFFVVSQFINKISRSSEKTLDEPFKSIDEMQNTVKEIDSTMAYIKELFRDAMKLRDEQTTEYNSDVVESAKEFIRQNYMDEELTLNMVASEVNVSPNHLSAMFSQKTGQTFVKYLTDVRLNKAKELLKCTAKRSNEICEEIGYKDPHYFSHIFKKNIGCSPMQYRERGGQE